MQAIYSDFPAGSLFLCNVNFRPRIISDRDYRQSRSMAELEQAFDVLPDPGLQIVR